MIGKFLRFAFPEKGAPRKAEAKAGRVAPKAPRERAQPAATPTEDPAEDMAETVRQAIAAAEREMLDDVGPPPESADQRGAPRPAAPAPGGGEDRARLIQSALTVHKLKQSALDDLDPKTRARLRVMAERMLGVDKPG